ncbi:MULTISPECIES: RNA-guided endonuclease InsQ/TnpB family protein [unclassified Synechococcus]|uniref:RNA-guided endonuclease InsQ/TnpB family protein n=1 Tax=unclassified Synechococcus TaxID=2626047 RepID=UPI0039C3CFAF
MLLAFKTALDLNSKQRTLAAQHAGVARHAYNWGLAICKQALENKHKLPTAIDLHKRLVAEVKKENPWYYQVSKCAPQQALRNLEQGIKRWRQGLGRFPVFKKKGRHDSFYLEGSIKISGNRIKVPVLGWLKCHEQLPATSPKNVTISRQADRWYISFKFEAPAPPEPEKDGEVVGVDFGIHNLATCSNGKTFPNPKAYRRSKKRLARLQRRVSRRQKGSRNRKRAAMAVARLHKRIADLRKDNLHKLTTYLAKRYRVVVIEDLNVSGMVKNPKLAGSIADCGFYEFKRQLEYKAKLYGCQLAVADRFYPSSQLCSRCGHQQKIPLHQRVFRCEKCGFVIDRDLNASHNLVKWYQTTLSSRGSYACGDSSAGVGQPTRYESLKQEGSNKLNESPLLFSVV